MEDHGQMQLKPTFQSVEREPASEEVLRHLHDIKQDREVLHIPIHNSERKEVGFLAPLSVSHLNDNSLIETFVRWRNQNLEGWLDQRPVTVEGTRKWLEVVVNDPTRMTFLIYWGKRLIGRCGFLHLTRTDSESDGVVRGERGGGCYFMRDTQIACLIWQFSTLNNQSIFSKILSTNVQALANCQSLGYDMRLSIERPIYRVSYPEGDLLTEEEHGEPCSECMLLHLRLMKSDFYSFLARWRQSDLP